MKGHGETLPAFLLLLTPLLLLTTSCAASLFAEPTPTSTPTTTETPLPTSTDTPLPTETPTITPDLTATQIAQREQDIRNLLTDLELPADTGALGWYQTSDVTLTLAGPDEEYLKLDEDLVAADFVIHTKITWVTDTWPNCGFWLRIDEGWDRGKLFSFLIRNFFAMRAWDISYWKGGALVSPVSYFVYTDYLSLDSGASNEITLSAVGNEFHVYLNGHFEGRYYDFGSILSEGRFAYFAKQNAGNTTCTYTDTWIWVYK